MTGSRARWTLATGAVVVFAVGAVLLATDVGRPADPHATPDPCALLGDDTVAELLGAHTTTERSEPFGAPTWRPLSRGEERVRCVWAVDPDDILAGRLRLDVERYHSAQFHLGRRGANRAAATYDAVRDQLCSYPVQVDTGPTQACVRTEQSLDLLMVDENLWVNIHFVRPLSGPSPGPSDELATRLTDEVTARLSGASGR
jgi:hypothetical protein